MSEWRETDIGVIPLNWKIEELKDCTMKITDGTHSTVLDNPDGNYFLLSCKNVKDGQIIYGNNERKIDRETINKLRKRTGLQKEDILLTTVGTIGESAIIGSNSVNFELQRSVAIIRPDKSIIDPIFLFQFTRSNRFKYQTLSLTRGSVQDCLFLGAINSILVPIPTLIEQKAIASILSLLDSKIGLLRRQNQTLENIAQTLFKHWFVDFEFSDKDGKPYKSSGGKMVESELGGIPDGWWVGLAGNFIKVQGGYAFKSKDFTSSGNNGILKIRNIQNQVVDINNTDFIDNKVVNTLDLKFKVNSGDMLIAMTGAEVAKIGIVANNSKNLWLNQRVGKFCENIPHGKVYIYFLFIRREYQNILKSKGDGSSAQPNISSSDIEGIEIIIPSEELVNAFSRIGEPIYETISQNLAEIETLTKVRDTLLPKLMSGQIRVKNL